MNEENVNILYKSIINDCLNLISKKKVDISKLAFLTGISTRTLSQALVEKNRDFSIYLKMYDLLLEW